MHYKAACHHSVYIAQWATWLRSNTKFIVTKILALEQDFHY